jgi:dTDP-4-amino-4,6-dideoxygalactose transaminase
MEKRIYLSPPHMGGDELKFVLEAFNSNWVAPVGPHIDLFEQELASYSGVNHCAVLSSGTAAIHLALILLGIKEGDDVICSSFTFAGSVNPVMYVGAKPVFIDSEPATWNMDPGLLQQAIESGIKEGRKPKAIIVVHLYGMPARIREIMAISEQYEIPVIEDAAEAIGSVYEGKQLGSFGHLGVFSFNGNKIITTSGGGALVSNHTDWIVKAKFLSTQARDPAPHYQHSEIGFNYRMSNVCAGIGRGQLRVLDDRVRRKREIYDFYKNHITRSGISFQSEPAGCYSNRWLTTVVIDPQSGMTSEQLRLRLEQKNIESRPLWKPMHLQPVFKHCKSFENGTSEALFNTGLCLPSGTALTETELGHILKVVNIQ